MVACQANDELQQRVTDEAEGKARMAEEVERQQALLRRLSSAHSSLNREYRSLKLAFDEVSPRGRRRHSQPL